jgi:hypothetical protein
MAASLIPLQRLAFQVPPAPRPGPLARGPGHPCSLQRNLGEFLHSKGPVPCLQDPNVPMCKAEPSRYLPWLPLVGDLVDPLSPPWEQVW